MMPQNYHQNSGHQKQIGLGKTPSAEDIEQQVICACILHPADTMPFCVDDLGEDDFYLDRHKRVWKALQHMWMARKPIEITTLANRLKEAGELDQVGGAGYLSQILDNVPASVNIEHHATILQEKRALRQAIEACNAIMKRAYSEEPALETIDKFVEMASSIRVGAGSSLADMVQMTHEATEKIDSVQAGDGRILGVDTGYVRLNKLTNGFQPSDLIILAARPSMGKTSLMLNMAKKQAKKGIKVGIFSLEQPYDQLYFRMLSDEADIDSTRFFRGGFTPQEMDHITDIQALLYELPIFIDDKGGLSIEEICARARKYVIKHGIQILYFDHLQLIGTKANFGESRNNQLGYITRRLKGIAKDLRIPAVCLSQLNRNLETRPNPHKRPRLSDLRESGNIEQDADIVSFLYRPEVYQDKESIRWPGYTDLFLGKHRNGPIGSVDLSWQASTTRFYEVDPRYASGTRQPL